MGQKLAEILNLKGSLIARFHVPVPSEAQLVEGLLCEPVESFENPPDEEVPPDIRPTEDSRGKDGGEMPSGG